MKSLLILIFAIAICGGLWLVNYKQSVPDITESELLKQAAETARKEVPQLEARIQQTELRLKSLLKEKMVSANEKEIKELQQQLQEDKKLREKQLASLGEAEKPKPSPTR